MSDLLHVLPPPLRRSVRECRQPAWTEPMLATLTHEPFSHPDWVFERKLDGVRALVWKHGRRVRLLSRNRNDMTATWPELLPVLARQRHDFVADGEIVAFANRRTSFARLQGRLGIASPPAELVRRVPAHLFLFDLLHLDGHDLTALPLLARKRVLRAALSFGGRLRFVPHRREHGERLLREACARGEEGLIAKRADSPYQHGRSRDWLKLKCGKGQELVVGGFTEPRGSRQGFGALLLGVHDAAGRLRYAGKVGTGFDADTLQRLGDRLRRSERADSPFADRVREKGAHWVEPRLVVQVRFTEWTADGKLRHPRFEGVRTDKRPRDVVREG